MRGHCEHRREMQPLEVPIDLVADNTADVMVADCRLQDKTEPWP